MWVRVDTEHVENLEGALEPLRGSCEAIQHLLERIRQAKTDAKDNVISLREVPKLRSADHDAVEDMLTLAEKVEKRFGAERSDVFFEHGQWFICIGMPEGSDRDTRSFAVVDCTNVQGENYLDVEEL